MKNSVLLRDFFLLSPALLLHILRAGAAFLILLLIGFFAGLLRPELTEPMLRLYTGTAADAGLYQVESGALMATILANNLLSALAPIAVGLIPFLYLSAFSLGLNAVIFGALAAYYQTSGLGLPAYLAGTLPHGVAELPALVISCGAGLYLCETVTGRVLGRDSAPPAPQALGEALKAYTHWVAPLLLIASALEAFVTPRIFALFM